MQHWKSERQHKGTSTAIKYYKKKGLRNQIVRTGNTIYDIRIYNIRDTITPTVWSLNPRPKPARVFGSLRSCCVIRILFKCGSPHAPQKMSVTAVFLALTEADLTHNEISQKGRTVNQNCNRTHVSTTEIASSLPTSRGR